jgi:hypothetical protein
VALLVVGPRKHRRGGKRSDQHQTCDEVRVSHWTSPGWSNTNSVPIERARIPAGIVQLPRPLPLDRTRHRTGRPIEP